MLSYEDSLDLKRRGYPQELRRGDWYYKTWERPRVPHLYSEPHLDTKYVKVPTTDGMIEWLGDSLELMGQREAGHGFGKFWAVGQRRGENVRKGNGETVESALAELWKKVKPYQNGAATKD